VDLGELRAFFNHYPELYTDCPSAVSRLLILLHDLEFSEKKLAKMIKSHPDKIATVLLSDLEQTLRNDKEQSIQDLQLIDSRTIWKNKASQVLQSHLGMNEEASEGILEIFPELYEIWPSLLPRIEYMLQQINLSPEKLLSMLETHPERTVQILMNDPEQNIKGPVAILQEELQMPIKEILSGKLWYVQRSEVRLRIATLKQYFSISDIKRLVQLEPGLVGGTRNPRTGRSLTISSSRKEANANDMSEIFSLLRNELKATDEDILKMSSHYQGIFLESADRVRSQVEFLLHGQVGKGLGLLLRRGLSTRKAETESEAQEIVRQRTLDLLVGCPALIISKNLVPALNYLQSIGCEVYDIGRIAYRRPQLLQFEVESLKSKVDYLSKQLDMSEGNLPGNTTCASRTVLDVMATVPDTFTLSLQGNLDVKFRYFREDLGFNTTELQSIFGSRPQILCLNLENNVIPKIDYLMTPIEEGGAGLTIEELRRVILCHPEGVRTSLELRIKPRCQAAIKRGFKIPDDLPHNFLTMSEPRWSKVVLSENIKKKDVNSKTKK